MPKPKKKKLSRCEAKAMLERQGISFSKDVHELSWSQLAEVATVAKVAGYHKKKSAPGSTGRMYFELLSRTSCKR